MNEISSLRKKRGWSQKDLAELLNISQQTISRLERCETHKVSSEMLLKLSGIFQVSPNQLLNFPSDHFDEQPDRKDIVLNIYANLDEMNKETWVMIGRRLLETQSPSAAQRIADKRGGQYDD